MSVAVSVAEAESGNCPQTPVSSHACTVSQAIGSQDIHVNNLLCQLAQPRLFREEMSIVSQAVDITVDISLVADIR